MLRVGWTSESDALNAFIGRQNTTFEIWANDHELLVERRSEDLGRGPNGIAASREVSSDGLTWTFHLHRNVT